MPHDVSAPHEAIIIRVQELFARRTRLHAQHDHAAREAGSRPGPDRREPRAATATATR